MNKNASVYFLSCSPVLWLILLAGMERLHIYWDKPHFSFVCLYQECLESLHALMPDLMGKYKQTAALNAFKYLLNMNFCKYVGYETEKMSELIEYRLVRLMVHEDDIIQVIRDSSTCPNILRNWTIG